MGDKKYCGDAVDSLHELLTEAGSNLGRAFDHIEDVESDLAEILGRVERVRSLASRFKGIEISPHVKDLMRLLESRPVAV
jgi:hypothetical protein